MVKQKHRKKPPQTPQTAYKRRQDAKKVAEFSS